MAQRTGAERFLAPSAKSASAGVLLALALAALLLAGCGGSDEEQSAQGSADATAAKNGAQARSAATQQGGEGSRRAEANGQGASGKDAQGQAAASSGQKHGPRIAQPKGKREQLASPSEVANATVADISLQSPAILSSQGNPGALAPTYTCDGKDSWPELRWSGIPPDTEELILYAMSVQPVEDQLFVDWAVAGLDPGLSSIEAGRLPKGAVLGTNGYGKRDYTICPAAGSGEIYMFALYALPQALAPPKGFDARELRHRILDVSGNVGLLPAVYARS